MHEHSDVAARLPALSLERARLFYRDKLGWNSTKKGPAVFVTDVETTGFRCSNRPAFRRAVTLSWHGRLTTLRRQSRNCGRAAWYSKSTICQALRLLTALPRSRAITRVVAAAKGPRGSETAREIC